MVTQLLALAAAGVALVALVIAAYVVSDSLVRLGSHDAALTIFIAISFACNVILAWIVLRQHRK
ncbi:MAG: hypothetical protein D8M53_01690 [Armatimonadetes bacterium]|nr:hypothetical protein [Armatimonadota bacterium]